jgi:hypothetical protein
MVLGPTKPPNLVTGIYFVRGKATQLPSYRVKTDFYFNALYFPQDFWVKQKHNVAIIFWRGAS